MKQLPALLLLSAVLAGVPAAAAGRQPATPQAPPGVPPAAAAPQAPFDRPAARETRQRLGDLLGEYPPSVREILRLDPTLLSRAEYLATYPKLAAFLAAHPEVAHNPSFFLGTPQIEEPYSPRLEATRALRDAVQFAGIALIVMTITAGIVFLVRTLAEHRRWQRALRTQSDLNTKLIDRFAASDELLAYLQSPQGRALTDAPAMPARAPRVVDAPLNRIFWSMQAGIVLVAFGAGLLFVGGRSEFPEVQQLVQGIGIVALTIGVGFAVSAGVSFVLSQRLGLVRPLSARAGGEAPGT